MRDYTYILTSTDPDDEGFSVQRYTTASTINLAMNAAQKDAYDNWVNMEVTSVRRNDTAGVPAAPLVERVRHLFNRQALRTVVR